MENQITSYAKLSVDQKDGKLVAAVEIDEVEALKVLAKPALDKFKVDHPGLVGEAVDKLEEALGVK